MFGAPGANSAFLDAHQVGIMFVAMDLTVGIGTMVCIFLMIGLVTGRCARKKKSEGVELAVGLEGVGSNAKKCVQVIPKSRPRIHQ